MKQSTWLRPSEVAKACGVTVQAVRFYEREGLLPRAQRSVAGHRHYSEEAVRIVGFIKRAQGLGFTLSETKDLLKLRSAGPRRIVAARSAAEAKIRDIDDKMRELAAMRGALATLVDACACRLDDLSCPILEALENTPKTEGA
jgi:DNA-binding transcriptional MerR regulator